MVGDSKFRRFCRLSKNDVSSGIITLPPPAVNGIHCHPLWHPPVLYVGAHTPEHGVTGVTQPIAGQTALGGITLGGVGTGADGGGGSGAGGAGGGVGDDGIYVTVSEAVFSPVCEYFLKTWFPEPERLFVPLHS